MKCATSSASRSVLTSTFVLSVALHATILTPGCGSGAGTAPPPKFSGNTQVTVVLTSTANDQVTRFDLQLQSLTLTSQSGNTVTLFSSQQPAEFMHLNGGSEPLTTVTVPQDI